MKKFIALLSLVSFIQCGSSDKKNVSEIIATGTLEEIQLQKTAHVNASAAKGIFTSMKIL